MQVIPVVDPVVDPVLDPVKVVVSFVDAIEEDGIVVLLVVDKGGWFVVPV